MINNNITINIDENIYNHFSCYEGTIPAGYWGNWLGVLTRANVWAFSKEVMQIYNKTRIERFEYPINDEHILDWYTLLQSVINAKDKFTMAAIGCGWGRWLSAGAFASKSLSKDYFLIGVEAEPVHFKWLKKHLKENKIDSNHYRSINAAAADYCGHCWFYVGKPASWYGQSIVTDDQLRTNFNIMSKIKNFLKIGHDQCYNNNTVKRIPCVDLEEIIKDCELINYMMLDIQGSEESFLTRSPEILQKKVGMINVGTHSNTIEQNLREYFSDLGWTCTFDIPMNNKVYFYIKKEDEENGPTKNIEIEFGDGVQVWVNNNL